MVGWLFAMVLHDTALMATPELDVARAPVAFVITGGRSRAASTLVWASTVLHSSVHPPGNPTSIYGGIQDSMYLDPSFSAPAAYGARLLVRAGDLDGSLTILQRGHDLHPGDPWFPWLLGMQLWVEADRPDEAAPWLRLASELDPDGEVHARAADLVSQGLK